MGCEVKVGGGGGGRDGEGGPLLSEEEEKRACLCAHLCTLVQGVCAMCVNHTLTAHTPEGSLVKQLLKLPVPLMHHLCAKHVIVHDLSISLPEEEGGGGGAHAHLPLWIRRLRMMN